MLSTLGWQHRRSRTKQCVVHVRCRDDVEVPITVHVGNVHVNWHIGRIGNIGCRPRWVRNEQVRGTLASIVFEGDVGHGLVDEEICTFDARCEFEVGT